MTLTLLPRGAARELRLDAPPGNILDEPLCARLAEAIRAAGRDPHVKAIVFSASGKHFSFGASVPEHAPGAVERFLPAFHDLFFALAEAALPAVASVRGLCLGGAFELVLGASFVVAGESAQFATPEIALGVLPPAASLLLPWKLGGAAAEDLVLTGRRMPAREALQRGLVTRVVPDDALEAETTAFLESSVFPHSAAALRHAVRAVRAPLHDALRTQLPRLERAYLDEVMATRDAREGIRAFLEKRAPVWADA